MMAYRIGEDPFVSRLWQVHSKVKKEGYVQVSLVYYMPRAQSAKIVQKLSLGLFRSDYMVHDDSIGQTSSKSLPQIKQVEFNTIASSFGGLSSQTTALHQ